MPDYIHKSFAQIHHLKEPFTSILQDNLFRDKNIALSILRLDEVHPIISGNKFYKLIYFLKEAEESSQKRIITFGGAYSNHLAATAFACKQAGIQCIGIVRGEEPHTLSPTLRFCKEQGMELQFITRTRFKKIEDEAFKADLVKNYGEHILIPEGGFSPMGAKGASIITQYFKEKSTHICLAAGTATTLAGVVREGGDYSKVVGFDILKNRDDIEKRLQLLNGNADGNFEIMTDYHFGGYAKKTNELLQFMNDFYRKHTIPLDFVYTGKMMFGVYDLISRNYFPEGSKILCIHTGGLQGNQSLPKEQLIY